MATAGRTVMFSGLIVAASLSSLLIFPQNFLRSMGFGGVAAVLVAMTAALTVLPALLTVLGPRIEAGLMPRRSGSRTQAAVRASTRQLAGGDLAPSQGAWARLAHSLMRRPVAYLLVIVLALMALGAPFLSARWGSVDERVLPASSPSRVAADLGAREFRVVTSAANIVVQGASRSQLGAYATRLDAVSGVRSARVVDRATKGVEPTSLVQVSWPGNRPEREVATGRQGLEGYQSRRRSQRPGRRRLGECR